MNLEQAQFEIEALQRRLAEYAGEVQRVKAECAAMRSALEAADTMLRYSHGMTLPSYTAKEEIHAAIKAALATDAGKGYVPADEHEEEKRRALIAGEDEADGDWLAAIQSKDWGGEISLAEGNEIASDGRNEIIASIHERFEELKKNTVPADKARVIAEALRAAESCIRARESADLWQIAVNKIGAANTVISELGLLEEK